MSEFIASLNRFDRVPTKGGWVVLITEKAGNLYKGTVFSPISPLGRVCRGVWDVESGKFILGGGIPGFDLVEACCI